MVGGFRKSKGFKDQEFVCSFISLTYLNDLPDSGNGNVGRNFVSTSALAEEK